MGPDQHADAVDLVQREAVDGPPQMTGVDRGRPRRAEPLRGERDPPRGLERQRFDLARHAAPVAGRHS